MTTRTWQGGTGGWTDPTQWAGGAAPALDDTALVNAGTVTLIGVTLDAETVDLGGFSASAPAVLVLSSAMLGKRFSIDSVNFGRFAAVDVFGVGAFGGTLEAASTGGGFALTVQADGGTAGDLVLLGGSVLDVTHGDLLTTSGTITSHGAVTVDVSSTLINNGIVALSGATMDVASHAILAGTGTVDIGLAGSLTFQAGAAASAETVQFTDVGGELLLANPGNYTGVIGNFQAGDLIDLTGTAATAASYDSANGLLTVRNGSLVVATLAVRGAASGVLTTASDGSGGTLIAVAGSAAPTKYLLAADDRAMQADVARATLKTASGVAITGAGVRIGIISNSFDGKPGIGAADPAYAAELAGYLPSGSAAVTVLTEGGPADDNEGMAMAELVHQVAPGAQLYFASGDGGLTSYADAVKALQQAGCTVIVDDLTYTNEPFFQNAGTLDSAITSAVASGVNYFAAAGNAGSAAYQADYNPQTAILPDGTTAIADSFANGAAAQTLTLIGGVTASLVLQWATPWPAAGQNAPQQLTASLYNAAGTLVATSYAVDDGSGHLLPVQQVVFTPSLTAQYRLVIGGTLAAGTPFKYLLVGTLGGGSTLAGTIDNPAANAGTLKGHDMLPGVNAVGAVDFGTTPAFGSAAYATTYYSATGPAQFLFDSAGNKLATPISVPGPALVAPVGAGTSVTGFGAFFGTSAAAPNAAAVAALMLQADPNLTTAQVTAILRQSATDLGLPASEQGAGLINADKAVQLALAAAAACYAAGTRIATARGAVAVERLRVGDRVRTVSGRLRPVVWLGRRRIDCRRHPRPDEVWPVHVQPHAFAPGQPARAVRLSPDHAVYVDRVLVPVRYLVNGATVAQSPVASVSYWHVELDRHDVLLADGLPAESFLDTGNRAAFENGDGPLMLHPDFARAVWHARACAPLAVDGPVVERVHARLLARAHVLGHATTPHPDLHAMAGGCRLSTTVIGRHHHIHLPGHAGPVRLRSRVWQPAHRGEPDCRHLGVALANLALDGVALAADDPRLSAGWHAPEPDWRWTDGDAAVETGAAGTLSFDLKLTGRYWAAAAAHGRMGCTAA